MSRVWRSVRSDVALEAAIQALLGATVIFGGLIAVAEAVRHSHEKERREKKD